MKNILFFAICLIFTFNIKSSFAQSYNWVSKFEATSFNNGFAYTKNSATDKAGNVYVCGAYSSVYFAGTTLSGPGGGTNGFVLKLTRNGSLSWIKSLSSSTPYCQVTALALDTNGNLYITGSYSGTVDFDPGVGTNPITSAGDKDIFVAKWDTTGNPIWTKSMGSSTEDLSEAIAVTPDGSGIFTSGGFMGTVDFDPSAGTSNLTAAASQDAFILCLNGSGDFTWVKGIFGSGNQIGLGLSMDATATNVYACGSFEGTTAFATAGANNIVSNGGTDGFIAKYDAILGGNPLWVKRIGGTESDEIRAVKQDRKSSSLYIGGTFRVTVDFDPGVGVDIATSVGVTYGPTNPHTDGFIVKLDADGNYLWKSIHANADLLTLAEIDVDKNGFVYSVGSFTGTATTSQGVTNVFATSQGWAVKLDSNGTNLWSGSYGQLQWSDETTTICVSDSLDINVGGDYNRGAPNGYAMNVDFAGGSTATNNGYMSAISQHSQKRPTLVSMYSTGANIWWNQALVYYQWNPNGKATSLHIEFGTTTALGSSITPIALGAGTTNVFSSATILPLTGNTKYYYRMTATNIHGSTTSWIDSLTTPLGPKPVITVLDPNIFGPLVTNITTNSATIGNIDVAANNLTTTVSIEYGKTLSYGSTTSTTPAMLTGNTPTTVSANLTGLTSGLYHFRVKATNAAGDTYSSDQTFIVASPLPLTWKSFLAQDHQRYVTLNWSTSQEVNCSHFNIEASLDGVEWKNISKINAKNETENKYTYDDYTAFQGNRYFRIKQQDIDGKFTYSQVVKINRELTEVFQFYPNPTEGNMNILTQTSALVEVFSTDGKLIYTQTISPSDNTLLIHQLAKGNYIARITTTQKEVYIKHFVRK